MSKGYLNKHVQALYCFAEYLRKSGRQYLPALRLDWEEQASSTVSVLSQSEIKSLYEATYQISGNRESEIIGSRDRALLSVFYGCGLRRKRGLAFRPRRPESGTRCITREEGQAE